MIRCIVDDYLTLSSSSFFHILISTNASLFLQCILEFAIFMYMYFIFHVSHTLCSYKRVLTYIVDTQQYSEYIIVSEKLFISSLLSSFFFFLICF